MRLRFRRAFSLIEVALAIAITGFAVVAIVGVVPIGLESFRKTKNVSVASQISRQIFSQIQTATFAALTNSNGQPAWRLPAQPNSTTLVRYFDEQGTELPSATNSVYQVNVRVLISTPFLQVPAGTPLPNPDLATVTIQVAFNPGNLTPDLDTATSTLWTSLGTNPAWTGSANNGKVPILIYNFQSMVARNS